MGCREQIGHLLIELAEVILDHAQLVQRELQQPTVDRMQRRTRLERIAQLLRRGAQARGGERREGGGIGLAIRQRLQHAAGADPEQVRDEAGHFDMRFLEQRLQAVLELHAVPGDLVLAAHHGAPEPLLRVGHEAQGELLGDQALHLPLRIREVLLAAAGTAIRLRLGEMECAREAWRTVAPAASGAPMLFQRFPHRPPVLRGRLHDDFLDVGDHDGQHLLVDVNSRDSVRHGPLLERAESVPRRISQGRGLSSGRPGPSTPNDSVNHARSGSNSCSGSNAPLAHFDLAALGAILTQ
jgi:hypothetical protein